MLAKAIKRLRRLFAQSSEAKDYGHIGVTLLMKNGEPVCVKGQVETTEHI